MKSFKMTTLKKILALLMVVALFWALIGCATDDPVPGPGDDNGEVADEVEPDPEPEPDPVDEDDEDEEVPEEPEDPPVEEPAFENVTIVYACPQVIEGFDYNTGCDYAMWVLNKFNITFEGVNLPWGEWHSMLSTWIMAQDMPDVAIFNYNDGTHADAANFVDQELIKRLPDNWRDRWPNVASIFDVTTLGPRLEEEFGGVYFLPRARFYYNLLGDPLQNHWSLWVRNDWVEAVGVEPKTYYTIPEMLDIARLIRDEDPGDIGAGLIPLALTHGNAANFFLRANSTHWDFWYQGDDGQYHWGPTHENTLQGLIYYFQAFDEGLLYPDFFMFTHEQDRERFDVTGTAAIAYLGAPTADVQSMRDTFENNLGIDRSAHGLATLLGASGYYHQRDLINYWGAVFFSPTVDVAVFERWMYLMDFMGSPEGYPGTSMGIRGIDWDLEPDGTIISHNPPGYHLAGPPGSGAKYPSLGHVLGSIILWDDLALDNPNIEIQYREESRRLYVERAQMSTPETFTAVDWNLFMFDSPAMRRAQGIDFSTEFANLVTSASSVDDLIERYHAWIESQMPIVQPVLDELNALFGN